MLRVTMKGSILTPKGLLLTPGTQVGRGLFTDQQILNHIDSGYLMETPDAAPMPQVLPAGGPAVKKDNVGEKNVSTGVTTPTDIQDAQSHEHGKTMVAGVDMASLEGDKGVSQGKVASGDEAKGEKLVSPGKWNLDPSALLDKDLDTLNLMILDIDGSTEPLETVEEAIAFLSMDWKGAGE